MLVPRKAHQLHIYENKYFTLILIYNVENYNNSDINDLSIEIFYV